MAIARNKVVPFDFKPFSEQQQKILTWWVPGSIYEDYDCIIADGAVRSGKTVSMALSFVMWGMENYNGYNFALCGKTVSALRRNVINPLKQMLKSRKYNMQDNRTENYITITRKIKRKDGTIDTKVNYFYIFGGKDESSQDLIQGITLAGLFCDEVALMPQSFVNQATARCSVTGAKMWFSCNPNSPFHWFKKEWIDKTEMKRALYLHFTMDDNLSLDEKVKERYKTLYTGVFYKRYILGLWVAADGAVYPMFDVDMHVKEVKKSWTRIFMSCDFGIQNATTFGIFGYHAPTKHYHQIASYYHSGRTQGQKTVRQYVDDCVQFIKDNMVIPEYIAVDPSAAPLIVELRKDSFFKQHKIKILPAKNNVQLGIQLTAMLFSNEHLTIDPSCEDDIAEITSYCWDSDKLDKGIEEVIKIDDHACDKIRYAVLTDSINYRTFDKEVRMFSGKGALE